MRPFGDVGRLVPVEVLLALQRGAAVLADEGPLAAVDGQMRLDGLAVLEHGVALRAAVQRRAVQRRRQHRLQANAAPPRRRHARQRVAPLLLLLRLLRSLQHTQNINLDVDYVLRHDSTQTASLCRVYHYSFTKVLMFAVPTVVILGK